MSQLLVALQFVLIFLIGIPSDWPQLSTVFWFGVMIFFGGLLLFGWAFASMPQESFTVMPEPRAGSVLMTRGPYATIRHPMYTGVLLCGAGAALAYGEPLKWFAVAALFVVLWIKLQREEKLLLRTHASYADYRACTKALLPWVL